MNTASHMTEQATATQTTPAVSTPPPRIVIAGGSGFIGQQLTDYLVQRGYHVVILTRSTSQLPATQHPTVTYQTWDGRTPGPWAQTLNYAVALVNLAGKNVNCRYTTANRKTILESRLASVKVLGEAIKQCENPPPVWVQAATLAIYGHRGDQLLTEAAHAGGGFSPQVATAWEAAVNAATDGRTRKVIMRISFALGTQGGALPALARLARLGLGGSVGSGRQYYSWVHIDDLCAITLLAITRKDMQGVYNVTSPNPERNSRFMRLLRKAVHRSWSPPAPAWAVKIGCMLMRTEAELALRSRYGVPARLQTLGYEFKFNHLDEAFEDLYPKRTTA